MNDHAPQFKKKPNNYKVEFIIGVILVIIFFLLMSRIEGQVCTDVIGGVCI